MTKIINIEDLFNQQKDSEEILVTLKKLCSSFICKESEEAFSDICNYLTLCAMDDIKVHTAVFNMQGKTIASKDLARMNDGDFSNISEGCLFVSLKSQEDGMNYLPLFTQANEIEEIEGIYPIKAAVSILISYVYCVEGIDGLIINPYTDAVIIDKENVELMVEMLQNEQSHA